MTDKRKTMEQLLENTRNFTREQFENTVYNDQSKFNPVILPVIGKFMSQQIANEIIGVQPMSHQPMQVGTMNHACSTWYWVSPEYDPGGIFSYAETKQKVADIEAWVEEVCGPRGDWADPDCRWWASNRKYIFKNEKDRTNFVLRWS